MIQKIWLRWLYKDVDGKYQYWVFLINISSALNGHVGDGSKRWTDKGQQYLWANFIQTDVHFASSQKYEKTFQISSIYLFSPTWGMITIDGHKSMLKPIYKESGPLKKTAFSWPISSTESNPLINSPFIYVFLLKCFFFQIIL